MFSEHQGEPIPHSEIPKGWQEFSSWHESEMFRNLAAVLKSNGEHVEISEQPIRKGKSLHMWADPKIASHIGTIVNILYATPEYNELLHMEYELNSSASDLIRASRKEEPKPLPSQGEQVDMLNNAYQRITEAVGGRDYFGAENEPSPLSIEALNANEFAADLIIARKLNEKGFDIKIIKEGSKVFVLAKGENKKVFANTRNAPEVQFFRFNYKPPIWLDSDYGLRGKWLDKILEDQEKSSGITQEQKDAIRKLDLHRQLEGARRGKWPKREIREIQKMLDKLNVETPEQLVDQMLDNIVERELETISRQSSNESFSHKPYTKADFESGMLEKRLHQISKEIIDFYGLDTYFIGNYPALEFVDLDTYLKRRWGCQIDDMIAPEIFPATTSYYTPKGLSFYRQPEKPLISIFLENNGDETLIEEALHWLHRELSGTKLASEERSEISKFGFFNSITSEALAFLTTKHFLQSRYRSQQDNFTGLPKGMSQEQLEQFVLDSGIDFETKILELVGKKSFEEWVEGHRFSRLAGDFPAPIIHAIGYFLGEKAWEKLQQGKILPSQLRNTFFRPMDSSQQYKELIKVVKG